jgi:hypothetical protein
MDLFPEVKKIQLLLDILEKRASVTSVTSLPLDSVQLHLVRNNLQELQQPLTKVIETLEELDKASLRAPALLRYFVKDLLRLSRSKSLELRNAGYTQLIRFIHYSPG